MGNSIKNCAGKGKDFYESGDMAKLAQKVKDNEKLIKDGVKTAEAVGNLVSGEEGGEGGDGDGDGEEEGSGEEEEGSGEEEEGEDGEKKKKKKKEKTKGEKWLGKVNAGISLAKTA